jgi:N-acetylmuramoyl-L-alanine amidase
MALGVLLAFHFDISGIEPVNTNEDRKTPDSWRENARSGTSPGRTASPLPSPGDPASVPILLPAPFKIALDVGHTPKKGGAVSARGVSEYEFNRRLVGELAEELQLSRSVQTFVVNAEGEEISLTQRVDQANAHGADVFLAIHHDSVKESFLKKWVVDGKPRKYCDDFHGYSLFISTKNAKAVESLAIAKALGGSLLRAGFTPTFHHAQQENRVVIDPENGIYLFDDLVVLKAAKIPAVLLECGVIVNRDEERNLNDPRYRNRLTDAIKSGLESLAKREPRG